MQNVYSLFLFNNVRVPNSLYMVKQRFVKEYHNLFQTVIYEYGWV